MMDRGLGIMCVALVLLTGLMLDRLGNLGMLPWEANPWDKELVLLDSISRSKRILQELDAITGEIEQMRIANLRLEEELRQLGAEP